MTTTALAENGRKESGFHLRDISLVDDSEIRIVGRLHAEILDFGPMSGLGEAFVTKIGYELPLKAGLLQVTLGLVDGTIAGFAAHTPHSGTFQREALRRHWRPALWTLLQSLMADPRRVRALIGAARVIVSRDELAPAAHEKVGEFAALAVRPEYRTAEFYRRTRVRVGEELTKHVIVRMEQAGAGLVRGFVDAHNKPALLMYQRLGAQFHPCRVGGRPMVQVSFTLPRERAPIAPAPAISRSPAPDQPQPPLAGARRRDAHSA
jgi:ribosomal protein S18 acetylase RimI-like enzyme